MKLSRNLLWKCLFEIHKKWKEDWILDIDISIVLRKTFLSYVVLNVERKKDLGLFFFLLVDLLWCVVIQLWCLFNVLVTTSHELSKHRKLLQMFMCFLHFLFFQYHGCVFFRNIFFSVEWMWEREKMTYIWWEKARFIDIIYWSGYATITIF